MVIRPEFLSAIQSRAGKIDAGAVAAHTMSVGTSEVGDLSTLASQSAGLGDCLLGSTPGSMADASRQMQLNGKLVETRANDAAAAQTWDLIKAASNRAACYPGQWYLSRYQSFNGEPGEWQMADAPHPSSGVFSVDLRAAQGGPKSYPLATVFVDTQAPGGAQAFMLRYPAQLQRFQPLQPSEVSLN